MPPTTPKPPSSLISDPRVLKREAKAMLTAVKDVERNIARYASPPDSEGLKLVAMQLALLQRQLADVRAGVEAVSK
jgi:hypothetical protein